MGRKEWCTPGTKQGKYVDRDSPRRRIEWLSRYRPLPTLSKLGINGFFVTQIPDTWANRSGLIGIVSTGVADPGVREANPGPYRGGGK